MPKRHRHAFIAIGIVIISGWSPAQEDQPTALDGERVAERLQQENASTNNGGTLTPNASDLALTLQGIEAAIRELVPREDQTEREEAIERDREDLAAQKNMAFWTMLMFWATLLGLLLIARTLHHTKRAADFAKGMVDEAIKTTEAAIKSADAAEASVVEARKATRLAEQTAEGSRDALVTNDRAWISVDVELISPLEFSADQVSTKGRLKLTNIGKSPATRVITEFDMYPDLIESYERANELARMNLTHVLSVYGRVLFPNAMITGEFDVSISIEEFRRRIDERAKAAVEAENPFEVTTGRPSILAGCSYILPGSSNRRFTYLPFEVRHVSHDHLGWDGRVGSVDPTKLRLEHRILSGQVA